jgi:hypothetical protein
MTVGLKEAAKQLLRTQLEKSFPSSSVGELDLEGVALAITLMKSAEDGDEATLAFAQAALAENRAALNALAHTIGVVPIDDTGKLRMRRVAGDPFTYYKCVAKHSRVSPGGFDPFFGELAMVRVRLPTSQPRDFSSVIGQVNSSDHLLKTVDDLNDRYEGGLGYRCQRVDLITPPRQLLRFAAVSVLLGYRDESKDPTCYVLEAGTALGQPKVVYLGKQLTSEINRITGYKPTQFSCSDNAYRGTLDVVGGDPTRLQIAARDILGGTTSAPPYMQLDVSFTKQTGTEIDSIWPGFLIARAALIVKARELAGLKNTCEDT